MRTQPTTEPTKQRIPAQKRRHLTEAVLDSAQPEAVSASDDLHARIAQRAYQIYIERGADHGYALNDWLQAEREILGPARSA